MTPDSPGIPLAPWILAALQGPRETVPEKREMIGRMRRIREVVDPFQAYEVPSPDGSGTGTIPGADLIATAEASVALADAIDRGEPPEVLKAALDKLNVTF
jgi:hypothetical protein